MKKKLFISICARGGSKGVPNKNIKKLDGKPLIAYSIILSNKLKQYFDVKLGLSTDDLKIKEVAQDFGLVTDYIRPNLLASDSAGKLDVIKALLGLTAIRTFRLRIWTGWRPADSVFEKTSAQDHSVVLSVSPVGPC